ncbi:MAG: UDP-N-acetylmuramate dehydrogenase [Eggerthellales bacterium]|nr:UDP-N-acetylmuramate dehydrogenase [Eggerthellales bacterium]
MQSRTISDQFVSEVLRIVGSEQVWFEEPLQFHTTFQIGGPAEVFVKPRSFEEVSALVALAHAGGVPMRVLGNGSDLLVSDQGVRGMVLCILDNLSRIAISDTTLEAQAGATNKQVASAALEARLEGFEFAEGIPGTIGGAAIMNAGAYGGEFCDVCVALTCVDEAGRIVTVKREDAEWGYRHSMMDDAGLVVLAATLQLAYGDPCAIQARMDDLAARRREKQPLDMPSAGSTFKRPEGYFAGKLIQDSGLQGYSVGGAQVSTKHAGFVVNAGGATASDVWGLIQDVQREVNRQFGVFLEPEVRYWE